MYKSRIIVALKSLFSRTTTETITLHRRCNAQGPPGAQIWRLSRCKKQKQSAMPVVLAFLFNAIVGIRITFQHWPMKDPTMVVYGELCMQGCRYQDAPSGSFDSTTTGDSLNWAGPGVCGMSQDPLQSRNRNKTWTGAGLLDTACVTSLMWKTGELYSVQQWKPLQFTSVFTVIIICCFSTYYSMAKKNKSNKITKKTITFKHPKGMRWFELFQFTRAHRDSTLVHSYKKPPAEKESGT